MFYRGIYSEAEQKEIDNFHAMADGLCGWCGEEEGKTFKSRVNIETADISILKLIARHNDPKNPLYQDEEYARHSCWGRVIAPPMFVLDCGYGPHAGYRILPEIGVVYSCHFGEDFEWFRPIYVDDEIRIWGEEPKLVDETPEGGSEFRVMAVYNNSKYYNQNNELVATFSHPMKWVYAEPGTPFEKIMRYGYEYDWALAHSFENVRWTAPYVYTPELAEWIQNYYENEPRRGDKPRYWEDVHVGEELPPVIMGPITMWDAVGALAPHSESTRTMMEVRRLCPEMCMVDEYGIPHNGAEMHLSAEVPKIVNWYSSTIVEHTINSFLNRMVSNWMGDDGFFRKFTWRKFANTRYGDTIISRGRVIRKYLGEDGECLVDIDTTMENIRGFVANFGPTTIRLPSSSRLHGEEPVDPGEAPLDLNPEGFQVGDRFRIRPRPDWQLPEPYPLEGKTGTIVEFPLDWDGYGYCILDEDCTGLDPRIVVGFRLDSLEKL